MNNDTEVKDDFVEQMLVSIKRHKNAFSCGARMVQYHDRDRLDDAGDYYCALGWSFAEARGRISVSMIKKRRFFLHVQVLQSTAKKSSTG